MPGPFPDPGPRGLGLEKGLTDALAAAFRAAGLPAPDILSLDPLSGGSINQAYRLRTRAGDFFCKWNPDAPPDMFEREREGLEALAGSDVSLVIPRVIAVSDPSEGAALVLEWLAPAAPSRESPWEALGRGLAGLHRHGSDQFGFARDNYCGSTPQENAWSRDWAGFFGERRLGALIRRIEESGRAGARETAVFRKLRHRLPALLAHGPAPCCPHTRRRGPCRKAGAIAFPSTSSTMCSTISSFSAEATAIKP